jgi:hypothetical protein
LFEKKEINSLKKSSFSVSNSSFSILKSTPSFSLRGIGKLFELDIILDLQELFSDLKEFKSRVKKEDIAEKNMQNTPVNKKILFKLLFFTEQN